MDTNSGDPSECSGHRFFFVSISAQTSQQLRLGNLRPAWHAEPAGLLNEPALGGFSASVFHDLCSMRVFFLNNESYKNRKQDNISNMRLPCNKCNLKSKRLFLSFWPRPHLALTVAVCFQIWSVVSRLRWTAGRCWLGNKDRSVVILVLVNGTKWGEILEGLYCLCLVTCFARWGSEGTTLSPGDKGWFSGSI